MKIYPVNSWLKWMAKVCEWCPLCQRRRGQGKKSGIGEKVCPFCWAYRRIRISSKPLGEE